MLVQNYQFRAGCKEVKEELVLRLLGMLGLDLTDAECSNAFASQHVRGLHDSSALALSPLLPSWHPPGIPDQARSTSSSADSLHSAAQPSAVSGTNASWVLPPPAFAHTAAPSDAGSQGQASEEGASARRAAHLPPAWHLASEERRQFMLRQLLLGPFKDSCFFAEALLDVMAASPTHTAGAPPHNCYSHPEVSSAAHTCSPADVEAFH